MVTTRSGNKVAQDTPKPKKLKRKVTFREKKMKTSAKQVTDPVHIPEFSSYPYDDNNNLYKRTSIKPTELSKIGKNETLKSVKVVSWSKKQATTVA